MIDTAIQAEIRALFHAEQAEHRQAIGELLLALEHEPAHPQRSDLLAELFRRAHSIKGSAHMTGLDAVEHVAHRIEDLFSALRAGALQLTTAACDAVYDALDALGALMRQDAEGKGADLELHRPILAALDQVLAGTGAPVPQPEAPVPSVAAEEPTERRTDDHWGVANGTVRLATAQLDRLLGDTGELLTCAVRAGQRVRDARDAAQLPARWRRRWRQLQPNLDRARSQLRELRPTVHHLERYEPELHAAPLARAPYDPAPLLDSLAEANRVIVEMEQLVSRLARQLSADHAQLAAVTNQVHERVRRTRMLPLTTIFNSLPLQLREMARQISKQVVLDLDDGGAEADREVLDGLRDVLLHLLRNALDHGIEPAAARIAAGKPAVGRIALRAAISGDQLILAIEDDGAGLDLEAIRARASAGGIFAADDLARMDEAQLRDLIFAPGFSTRQDVGLLSGRGVGLDVVRSRVERLRGRIAVHSTPGAGCAFTITVPLSLTSSRGLLIRAGQSRYALPIDAVRRIIAVAPQDIVTIEGRTAVKVDGQLCALAALAELLGDANAAWKGQAAGASRPALILGGERPLACLVDVVLGEQELVIHRLPAPLQQVRFIAGATILADASVIPILEMTDLLRAAVGERRIGSTPAPRAPARRTVLVADDSITTRMLEKNILEAAGYQVRLATDGAEALDLLRRLAGDGGCDLLLSDVDMPRLNGFELTAQVRSDPRLQHLPVVLVTSLGGPADRERGIAAGADAYIVKQAFKEQTLLDTIAQLL